MDDAPAPPPELAMLMERLRRAETAAERQAAYDAIVAYQRRTGVRANPSDPEPPQV